MAANPSRRNSRHYFRSAGLIAVLALAGFQGQAQASVQSCRAFSEKGVHASALVACSAVINRNNIRSATRATALFYRANSRYSTRNIAGALDDINRSLEIRPGFGPALALRAAIRTRTGDVKGAATDLDAAIASGLDSADLRGRRATLRLAAGDLAGAAEDLSAVVTRSPRDAISQLRLAIVLNELGRNGPALDAANRAVALNRDNADAYGVRAKIRSDSGDLDGALEDFARAETGAADGARYLVGKADILVRSGRPAKALEAIERALAIDPNLRTALVLKADILQAEGRPAGARDALDRMARSDPLLAVRNARLALGSGDLKAALADYNTAIGLDPKLDAAYFERGQVQARIGNWSAAIPDFDAALAANTDLANRRLFYLRGKAKYRTGDLEGAADDLSRDLAIAKSADGLLWRALVYADLGDFDLALKDASQLVAMAPDRPRSYAVLGDVQLRAGRLAQGRKSHQKALSIDPDFAPSKLRLKALDTAE